MMPVISHTCSSGSLAEHKCSKAAPVTGHGTLQADGWSMDGRSCFHFLREGLAIFAGSSFVFRLDVDNPSTPLLEDAAANTWYLSLRSMGSSTSFREVNLSAFASAALLGTYSASKAVLGRLTDATMQPLSFQPSLSFKPLEDQKKTIVQLFFRSTQRVAAGGAVRLQAPPGFDFGSFSCQSMDLSESHYYSQAASITLRLPQLNCSTSSASHLLSNGTLLQSFSVALVSLKARIFAAQMYGWQISIRAPSMAVFDEVRGLGWHLYTLNSAGSLVDGTPTSIPMGPDAYKLHYRSLPLTDTQFSSLQPFTLSGQESMLRVSFRLGGIPLDCSNLTLTDMQRISFNVLQL